MKQSINTPHDRFSRAALSEQRVARAFFETHLSPELLAQIDLSTLALTQESFVDEELHLAITDMLFTVQVGQQPGYLYPSILGIYLLVESQSRAERLMPLRVLKYKIDIMNHHLNISSNKTLPVVYGLVLYNGKTRYNEPIALVDLFAPEQRDMAKTSVLQPFQLIDLTQLLEEALRKQVWLYVLEGCLKHIDDRDILPFVTEVVQALQQVGKPGGTVLSAGRTDLFNNRW